MKENKEKVSMCRKNWRKNNPDKVSLQALKDNAIRSLRIPKWLTKEDWEKINLFYNNCPEGMVVDHIIPLRGKTISGLHVLNNLQYLTKEENLIKGNKFELN